MNTSVDVPRVPKIIRPNLVLMICCFSLLMVSMDATIVNVALPSIRRDLDASIAGLQWVIDAYTMVIASLLMFAGSMADRIGRRRVFQVGMSLFMLGSLLCSVAPDIRWLIAFRVVQALGATMLNPVAMSIIVNTFTEPKVRASAIGVWGAVAGIAMALGPLVGGALTQSVGWRSIFWINLPIGTAAIVLAALYIPESKALQARRIDPIGQILVFTGMSSMIYAVIEGPQMHWASATIIGLFATSFAAAIAIILYEPRRTDPLLDLRFFRSVPFSSAAIIAICSFAAFGGFLFLNALYLQEVRGLSSFRTGLYTLPLALATIVCSPLSGRLVGTYGTRPSLLIASGAMALSGFILTHLRADSNLNILMLTYVMFGIGFGSVNAPITNTAVSGMPKTQAGLAAAVASTSRQVGASLGVAVAGTIVGTQAAIGASFSDATHAFWWCMIGAGSIVFVLGLISSSGWARSTAQRAVNLLAQDTSLAVPRKQEPTAGLAK